VIANVAHFKDRSLDLMLDTEAPLLHVGSAKVGSISPKAADGSSAWLSENVRGKRKPGVSMIGSPVLIRPPSPSTSILVVSPSLISVIVFRGKQRLIVHKN